MSGKENCFDKTAVKNVFQKPEDRTALVTDMANKAVGNHYNLLIYQWIL